MPGVRPVLETMPRAMPRAASSRTASRRARAQGGRKAQHGLRVAALKRLERRARHARGRARRHALQHEAAPAPAKPGSRCWLQKRDVQHLLRALVACLDRRRVEPAAPLRPARRAAPRGGGALGGEILGRYRPTRVCQKSNVTARITRGAPASRWRPAARRAPRSRRRAAGEAGLAARRHHLHRRGGPPRARPRRRARASSPTCTASAAGTPSASSVSRKISGAGFRTPTSSEKVRCWNGARSPWPSRMRRSVRPGVRMVFEITARRSPRAVSASSPARAPVSGRGGTSRAGARVGLDERVEGGAGHPRGQPRLGALEHGGHVAQHRDVPVLGPDPGELAPGLLVAPRERPPPPRGSPRAPQDGLEIGEAPLAVAVVGARPLEDERAPEVHGDGTNRARHGRGGARSGEAGLPLLEVGLHGLAGLAGGIGLGEGIDARTRWRCADRYCASGRSAPSGAAPRWARRPRIDSTSPWVTASSSAEAPRDSPGPTRAPGPRSPARRASRISAARAGPTRPGRSAASITDGTPTRISGSPKMALRRHHAQVTGHGQLEARAQAGPVHHADGGKGRLVHGLDGLVEAA